MQEQLDKRFRIGVLFVAALSTVGIIGISAAMGKAESSPECAQLARIVAGREHSMLDSRRFRNTERQAYSACARDPAAFRKLIRIS
jgi:hypothetical protein